MNVSESQFSDALDRPYAGTPANTILIATTPLCGGAVIAQAMAATGNLGVPFEYANPANAAEWARRLETTTPETTLAEIMARRTTPNGVFAIQVQFEHGVVFETTERLLSQLPGLKVVHVRRADVLRQAVSFAVAKQTGIWASDDQGSGDTAAYDPGLIDHCLNDIAVQNALWTSAFSALGIEPLEVTYETAAKGLARTIRDIAEFCGVSSADFSQTAPAMPPAAPDDRMENWIARYADDRMARRAILRRIGGLARRAWPNTTSG